MDVLFMESISNAIDTQNVSLMQIIKIKGPVVNHGQIFDTNLLTTRKKSIFYTLFIIEACTTRWRTFLFIDISTFNKFNTRFFKTAFDFLHFIRAEIKIDSDATITQRTIKQLDAFMLCRSSHYSVCNIQVIVCRNLEVARMANNFLDFITKLQH